MHQVECPRICVVVAVVAGVVAAARKKLRRSRCVVGREGVGGCVAVRELFVRFVEINEHFGRVLSGHHLFLLLLLSCVLV